MLSEGATAPGFELPALVDGERRRVALDEYLGDDVVILAFYPADFNPACDEESCDLDELDLFTMQKDVTILGISPDSVYSHRAFAESYDLKVPLLADTDGEVAERYDIGLVDDIGQRLIERAVAVVDHDGTVTYAWSTDDMSELPRVDELKDALAETGGDDTAFARYRVGHAHYTEGRRAFTSAMEAFENTEWVMAQHDFQQACEEFEEAADRFDTALRFVDDEALAPIYEGANEKATALWQAADWLTRAASAYSSGSGAKGQKLRDDAEVPLSTVREYIEPPDPDDPWPPDVADLEKAETEDYSILPTDPDVGDAALDVDIDAEVTDEGATASDPAPGPADSGEDGAANDGEAGPATASDGDGGAADADFDDAELAEIQAELAANNPESEPSVEEVTEESTAIVEAPPMGDSDGEGEPADADVPEESTSIVDPPSTDASESADDSSDDGAGAVDETATDEGGAADETAVGSGDGPTEADASGTATAATDEGVADGEEAADVTSGGELPASADAETDTAADGTDGADERDGTDDEDGTDLQFELAEPDPDPIDAGPPAPPVEEADGESGLDE
ncbi:peroxiredoxin [Haloarcula onubensis]|uniref:Peroxiredoxin n=1 Tax=Haloarcula onubensis TaxID=2950539 RepID=A0ABU2FNH9_9EURY|nr:peroxiredoxin [Halomicroarcula sp. S3CR25-11]MDS0281812.1 peroxiredoxin [Halomicroarcula sp. S3CR25-11]